MKSRRAIGATVGLTLILAATAPGLQAADDDPAKLAPIDALAFMGITDLDAAWADMRKTAGYKMMNDPAGKSMKQVTLITKLLNRAKVAIGKALDTPPDKLENPFGGSMALYVVAPAGADEQPGLVVSVGVDDKERLSSYFGTALGKFREAADDYEQVDFSGFEIHRFKTESREPTPTADEEDWGFDPNSDPFSLDDEAMDKMVESMFGELFTSENLPPRFAMCLADKRLYVSQTADLIRDAVRRGKGGESLADHDDYKMMFRFDPVGRLRILINTPRIVEMLTRDDPDARKTAKILGINGAGALVAHARFGDSQAYESRFDALLVLKGDRSGLAKILSMDNAAIAPPANIGEENAIYVCGNIDAGVLVDEVQRMIRQQDPAAAEQMAQSLGDVDTEDGPMNIRKDVIDNLRAPARFMIGFGKPYGPDTVHLIASIGHRDKTAMERLLAMVAPMSPMPLSDRDVNGHRLWEMGGIAMSVADDAILVGSSRAVESMLRGEAVGAALAESRAFKNAAEHLPGEASGIIFADSRRMFEGALALAKQRDAIMANAMANPTAMLALQMAEGMTSAIKQDQLDVAGKLLKYQTAGLLTMRTTSDGIVFSQVTLHPQGE
jgi:hypothetical protein